MPGPAPTPTKLKLLAGNPGKERLNRREPQPRGGDLPCPDWLSDFAKAEWRRIVPIMQQCRVFTAADAAPVVAYVVAFDALYRSVTTKGTASPATLAALRQAAAELGLTPASRSRIVVPDSNDGDKAETYFAA